jgi:hypothetical protein
MYILFNIYLKKELNIYKQLYRNVLKRYVIHQYVIKFVSNLRQVDGFLRVLRFFHQ